MRVLILLLLFSVSLQAQKTNVVFVLLDDAGFADISYNRNYYDTPNIDALFTAGVRLNNYYTRGTCSPARAAFMSGVHPYRYGMNQSIVQSDDDNFFAFPNDTLTIAEHLNCCGYNTAMIGKWHLGNRREDMPYSRGFDYTLHSNQIPNDYYSWASVSNLFKEEKIQKNGKPFHADGRYLIDMWYDEAVDFISVASDKYNDSGGEEPFFLYLADTSPHGPWQGDTPCLNSSTFVPEFPEVQDGFGNDVRIGRSCMMEASDRGLGRIMAELSAKGVLANTMIIYTSDNGAPTPGSTPNNWNDPFQSGKGRLYDGGIHTFCAVYQQGKYENLDVTTPVDVVDWLPTILDVADCQKIRPTFEDGVSIEPLLAGGTIPDRHIILDELTDIRWAVLSHDLFKVGDNFGAGRGVVPPASPNAPNPAMYNLNVDVGETNNIYGTGLQQQIDCENFHASQVVPNFNNWQKPNDGNVPVCYDIPRGSCMHEGIHYTSIEVYEHNCLIPKNFEVIQGSASSANWSL